MAGIFDLRFSICDLRFATFADFDPAIWGFRKTRRFRFLVIQIRAVSHNASGRESQIANRKSQMKKARFCAIFV